MAATKIPAREPVTSDPVASNTAAVVAVGALVGFAWLVWLPLVLIVVAIVAGLIAWRFR